MAANKKINKIKSEKDQVNTEISKPTEGREKSAMELEALKNGGSTDPVGTEIVEKPEDVTTDQSADALPADNIPVDIEVIYPVQEETTKKEEITDEQKESSHLTFEQAREEATAYNENLLGKLLNDSEPDNELTDNQKEAVEAIREAVDKDPVSEENKGEEPAKLKPEVQEDITQAVGIIGAIAEYSQIKEDNAKAKELMEAQNLNEIWRCPDTGYFFSRKDYAENYEIKNKCSLQHYKK